MNEHISPAGAIDAGLVANPGMTEQFKAPHCTYSIECIGPDGTVRWSEVIENTVVTVGKNLLLDTLFAGSNYSASVACGLISSVSWSAIAAGDTMGTHSGWTEAGSTNAPTYTAPRKTPSWSSASSGSKATSSAMSFAITGSGTVKGAFLVLGGSTTIENATGTLYSAGLFSGGDKIVGNGDTLNVSLTMSC